MVMEKEKNEKIKTNNFKNVLDDIYDTFKDKDFEISINTYIEKFDDKNVAKHVIDILVENSYLEKKESGTKISIKRDVKLHGVESREDFVSRAYELLMNA